MSEQTTCESVIREDTVAIASGLSGNVQLAPEETFTTANHPIKCDKSRVEFIKSKLNYDRFSLFLQTKCLVERCKRFKLIELGEAVPQVEHFTDERLHSELEEMHGEFDRTTDQYRKIFNNYKEERLQQIEQWSVEESQFYDIENSTTNFDLNSIDANGLFTQSELESFRTDDYFVLPRPKLSTREIVSMEKIPLSVIDPELHLPFMIPPICDINVGAPLAGKIHNIIKAHPSGITCEKFVREFERLHGYRPNVQYYESFMGMIDDLSQHILFVQTFDTNTMLYPMMLQGLVCTPGEMFFSVFHKIKVVLSLFYGIGKLDDIMKASTKVFGWNLNLNAWGFESELDFISYALSRWPCDDSISLITEDKLISRGNRNTQYLVSVTDDRIKLLRSQEKNLAPKFQAEVKCPPLQQSKFLRIHPKYIQPGQTIPDEMSNFHVGDVLFMVVTYYTNPTNFYMVREDKLQKVNEFNKKLRLYCEHEEAVHGKEALMINPNLISPGYCCIVIGEDGLYHRAQVLATEQNKYKCRLLDYGDLECVELEKLRYLDINVGTGFPVQAFHCKLIDVTSPTRDKNGSIIWTDSVVEYSYNLMVPDLENPPPAKVFLKRLNVNKEIHLNQWEVWMCDRKRKIKDFGATIMDFVKKNH